MMAIDVQWGDRFEDASQSLSSIHILVRFDVGPDGRFLIPFQTYSITYHPSSRTIWIKPSDTCWFLPS
jgi:hypothetical protein